MGTSLEVSAMPLDAMLEREWLATNGLGGYACSTVPCLNSRKYHGLLVAAMAPPVRRMVLLSRVEETVHRDGWPFPLATNEYPGTIHPEGHRFLRAFSHEPFPRWAYQGEGWTLEKSLRLARGKNTVVLTYALLGGDKPVDLELRPLMALRGIHELTYQWQAPLEVQPVERPKPARKGRAKSPGAEAAPTARGECLRIPATGKTPEVFFAHDGAFDPQANWYFNTIYRREQERGYPGLEDLWMPGVVRYKLSPGDSVHFACSTDAIDPAALFAGDEQPTVSAAVSRLVSAGACRPVGADSDPHVAALVRAADQFIASVPAPRAADEPADADADAAAQSTVAVISQYPWSAPSVRLALVAFPGLFLVTGRHAEAAGLLSSLAGMLDGGLLPSELPEDGSAPLYHGADVSLWFVNAVHEYLRHTGDEKFVRDRLFEPLAMIVHYYRTGTRLGISADAEGLISTREAGVGTTWMDARAGDWVVTPRAGKPVELNALWYNALCVAAELSERFGEAAWAAELAGVARSVKAAFNERFWNESAGCCFDVIGDDWRDVSVRPNQLLAASLPFPVLDLGRHERVLKKVTDELLTPVGVRTLAPSDSNYQGRYGGDVALRDRAHHNGSAFSWLLGPLVTAHVRVNGRGRQSRERAMEMIRGCLGYLEGDGVGQLCELFDGNPPHAPGGAIAAAAAVGELLRCYVEDVTADLAGEATGVGAEASAVAAAGSSAGSGEGPKLELTLTPQLTPPPISQPAPMPARGAV